jgi:hypothetical protein
MDGTDVCILTISAEYDVVVQIALERIRSIAADPEAFKQELQRMKIHVFIDDSNVFIGAEKQCAEDASGVRQEWVDVRGMVRAIEKGRWTEKQVVVGSGRATDPRFAAYKQQGYEVTVMERGRKGGEVGVDDTLQAGALMETSKRFSDNRCLVLVTGDGNPNYDRVSFPQVAEAALQHGWSVEVWAWKASMADLWSRFENEYG